jgi:hypothetical protein
MRTWLMGRCTFIGVFVPLDRVHRVFERGAYLGVESMALNGRWNNQLASAIGVDRHNWMYHMAFGFFTQRHMRIGHGS